MTRLFLRVTGVVQGVGFRPFVARLARDLDLRGHVENTTRGVEIEVEGPTGRVDAFHRRLVETPPPAAQILGVEVRSRDPKGEAEPFRIRASRVDPVAAAVIPPDIATCPACLAELTDPGDRRHGYPFLNCTDCGPRYTIIGSIPYDRPRTAMAGFDLCPLCAAEYADPDDRRFHAQPTACPACGPSLTLTNERGDPLPEEPLAEAVEAIRAGSVVAILGLGGFHLACDALSETAVARLRRRKHRPAKPLAVMVPDPAAARELVDLTEAGRVLLEGPRAPIVLAPRRPGAPVAPSVAPGQELLGIFVPYTPLHHLLFRRGGFRALVMTSGNRSDEPILASWGEARERLAHIADRFVLHDRPILHRIDDSVVRDTPRGPTVLRRARGYAPAPLGLPNPGGKTILAVGAELANTFCVVRDQFAYLGPHVGDLKNLAVEEAFETGIAHLLDLLRVEPSRVACDRHPGYRSSRYAAALVKGGLPVTRVQHHEAHVAACMAEHGFEGRGLGVALDGLGYGTDGTLWGGEILAGDAARFERVGHLAPVPQPGGDRAAREPWRMAASHLRSALGADWVDLDLPCFEDHGRPDRWVLETAMSRGLNAPLTSSCGRLFDAVAAILGFRGAMRYSAQAPMELEALASRGVARTEAYPIETPSDSGGGPIVLDPGSLIRAALADARAGRARADAALGFHRGLADLVVAGVEVAAGRTGLDHVFLSGGCLQNALFTDLLCRGLETRGLVVHTHRQIPPNDGGIAFGQAACAVAR